MIPKASGKAGAVTQEQLFGQLSAVAGVVLFAFTASSRTVFVTSHYICRWRTAMNDYYVANWHRLRHIEGASQRVQEDTQRFPTTLESLGASLIDALMTLIAFLPILWVLSAHVNELPLLL